MKSRRQFQFSAPTSREEWLAILAALGVGLFGSWFAEDLRGDRWWLGVIYGVLFLTSLCILYSYREMWTRPRTRHLQQTTPPRSAHLILFLSNLRVKEGDTEGWQKLADRNGLPEGLDSLPEDLQDAMNALVNYKQTKPMWSWEMPLRAIRHHLGEQLQTITLICSKESLRQAAWFARLVRLYLSALPQVELRILLNAPPRSAEWVLLADQIYSPDEANRRGWDFEDFDQLVRAFDHLLNRLHEEKQAQEEQIVIDITGGQKPNSIAGAAVTFNTGVTIQYVQTGHDHEVIGYELRLMAPSAQVGG